MGAQRRRTTTGAAQLARLACLISAGCSMEVGQPPAELDQVALLADNGIFLDNGLKLTNGADAGNGIKLTNGFNLANGIDLANGIKLTNGVNTIEPPPGSDLEAWIDADPTMRLRVIRYQIECALAPATAIEVIYREQSFTFVGLTALGPSWLDGLMTTTDQERVSACLLARVNTRGRVLRISLSGPYDGLDGLSADELASYPSREATAFGNLFLDVPHAFIAGIGCGSRACLPGPDPFRCDCGIVWDGGLCVLNDLPYDTACWDSDTHGEVLYQNPITAYVAEKWSGGACESNADCIYDNCASGTCGGAGAACNFGEMCAVDCSSDHLCGGAGALCHGNADCVSGTCVLYSDEFESFGSCTDP